MTRAVYPVHGGMEDWAYAGSWDTLGSPQVQCRPVSNGAYSASRTQYQDATLRCALILVETSDDKIPQPATMGAAQGVLQHEGAHDGHVPRNVRVALVALDTVEPYVHPLYTNGHRSDELQTVSIKQGELLVSAVVDSRGDPTAHGKASLNVTFDVGGGFTVGKHGLVVLQVESIADATALHSAARGHASSFVRGSTGARQTAPSAPQTAAPASAAVQEWVHFVQGTKTTTTVLGTSRALRATAATGDLVTDAATAVRAADVSLTGLANTRWGKQGRAKPEVESSEDLETSAFHPRFTLGADLDVGATTASPCTVHLFAALPWATVDTDFSKLYGKLVTPANKLPQAHLSRTRGNGRYTASVSVPAADAEDGADVSWKVRGQFQAVAPPQMVAVVSGDAAAPLSQCSLYNHNGEAAAASPSAAPARPSPVPPTASAAPAAASSSPTAQDGAAASPSTAAAPPSRDPPSEPDASDKMKEDASGIGVKLVLGVLVGLVVVVAAVVAFAKWRASAQEQRYRQAHAAVGGLGGAPPSAYSDGSAHGATPAGPPAGSLADNGGVAEVVLSPDLGPSAPQGDLTPFDTDHDSDSSEGDLDRLIGSPGLVEGGRLVCDGDSDGSGPRGAVQTV